MAHNVLDFYLVGGLELVTDCGAGLGLGDDCDPCVELELDLYVVKKANFFCEVGVD